MRIDELVVSKAIIESYKEKLVKALDVDVAIVGAGPSGLVCGYYLAKEKLKVALFERKLSIGGGMWGGGIMFNQIVVQKDAKPILDELGVKTRAYQEGYYLADAIESISTLTSKAVKTGVSIFNLLSVEDVLVRGKRVCGLVLNWSAVEMAGLHVDPISMRSRYIVDATGHAAEVARIVERKSGIRLKTKTGRIIGEGSMDADLAEKLTISNSKEACPGLYVCGMCANSVFGGPRMGPIFGGMLLSGRRVASKIIKII